MNFYCENSKLHVANDWRFYRLRFVRCSRRMGRRENADETLISTVDLFLLRPGVTSTSVSTTYVNGTPLLRRIRRKPEISERFTQTRDRDELEVDVRVDESRAVTFTAPREWNRLASCPRCANRTVPNVWTETFHNRKRAAHSVFFLTQTT